MKKIALVFSALILILTSCSSDDENNSNQNLILLKKSISTGLSGNVRTTDYVYDGNKIVSATTGALKFNYYYTNDLITKIEASYNQVVSDRILFLYDNSQKLIEKTSVNLADPEFLIKEKYEYNFDGTIDLSVYRINTGVQDELIENIKYFIGNNQEIIKKENYRTTGIEITNYEYDNKNNIFKNVLNLKKLLRFDSNVFNCISYQTSVSGVVSSSTTSQFTYNSDGFPITNSSTVVNGSSTDAFTIQHFYE